MLKPVIQVNQKLLVSTFAFYSTVLAMQKRCPFLCVVKAMLKSKTLFCAGIRYDLRSDLQPEIVLTMSEIFYNSHQQENHDKLS